MAASQNIALSRKNNVIFPSGSNCDHFSKNELKFVDLRSHKNQTGSTQLKMTEANIKFLNQSIDAKTDLEVAYRLYFDELYRYAFSMLRDSSHAEDTVQSVFMESWQGSKKIEIHTSMRAFLFKAVYFKCMNEIKHRNVRAKFEMFALSGKEEHYKEDLLQKEMKQKIDEAMAVLPSECRKVFELCKMEGLKYHEVAAKLNISPKTVENQMGKALKTLRQNLSRYLLPITSLILFWS
jgi:RNA polymerase sigma-70 factor, ECF subfamily